MFTKNNMTKQKRNILLQSLMASKGNKYTKKQPKRRPKQVKNMAKVGKTIEYFGNFLKTRRIKALGESVRGLL
jgi:hypothetical protein